MFSLLSRHICLDWPLTSGLKCAPADLVVTVSRLSETPIGLDHVRPLLGDHNGGGVGVPGHHVWHYRGVYHPQSRHSVNLKMWGVIIQFENLPSWLTFNSWFTTDMGSVGGPIFAIPEKTSCQIWHSKPSLALWERYLHRSKIFMIGHIPIGSFFANSLIFDDKMDTGMYLNL